MSCVMACSRMLLERRGLVVPEAELRDRSSALAGGFKEATGTFMHSVPALLARYGVAAVYETGVSCDDLIRRLPLYPQPGRDPVMVAIFPPGRHAVLVRGLYRNDDGTLTVTITDPSAGGRAAGFAVPLEQFRQIFAGTIVSPR